MTSLTPRLRPIKLEGGVVKAVDQRRLPHEFVWLALHSLDEMIHAVQTMVVRGAPLIGASAAWGMYIIVKTAPSPDADDYIRAESQRLKESRPTAVNLAWAVERILPRILAAAPEDRLDTARKEAEAVSGLEAENCRLIGVHGLPLIREISERKNGGTVQIMTHCNAGWLACLEWGTATAPVYAAHEAGVPVHVWVDETRPLNQGSRLTAWELARAGVPHTVICDNAGGHLMQHGMVDLLITGTDRTTCTGDVANKIGTYLKALAAKDNNVPFYVALPSTTFDWTMRDGLAEIPIEVRDPEEVRWIQGRLPDETGGRIQSVLVLPENSPVRNDAFDVTPARLVTGFITERGVCPATEEGVAGLFPERS
ncbi:MAG: S-methyl-5-thioribose-1-phosphate isomerase [Desulfobacterales bacterium]|nr:MAG: S-methyl-5-thioribose-1-phosphate isomerase [Desulfobacterales bacterium]